MDAELKSLQIDRNSKHRDNGPRWARWWILTGIVVVLLLGAGRFAYERLNAATEVETVRVRANFSAAAAAGDVVLNATGYIVAAHKIELASKVVGKVAWIGVDKGDKVKQGQVLVRLEDDEYLAQVEQAKGQLANLQAKLAEQMNGSLPQEIAKAKADVAQARADLIDAKASLGRTQELVKEGVLAKQTLDDALAKYDGQVARVNSLEKAYELVEIGTRKEQIDATRGQIEQTKGQLAYAETFLKNTEIRAPVDGTILERNVERGEFVTTGFVGDKGAKGYVVSMANLRDLKVELDINQNDFAKLQMGQKGVVTTDAFPDLKYNGIIDEISPEANRQKATVQVKVKILDPDDHLRPEMNASVAFLSGRKAAADAPSQPTIVVPASAVRNDAVFVVVDGKAVRRTVKTAGTLAQGVRIQNGLIGGEDLIVNPPAGLKDGEKVRVKG